MCSSNGAIPSADDQVPVWGSGRKKMTGDGAYSAVNVAPTSFNPFTAACGTLSDVSS
ncbi:hypothetical protein [Dietzia sp. HMSC21D01]